MSQHASRSYEIEISATPECIWQALVDPNLTKQYYFDTRVESEWRTGAEIFYRNADGVAEVEGRILELSPPTRMATTFIPKWVPDSGAAPASVVWEIISSGEVSKLRLTNNNPDPNSPIAAMIHNAWQPTLERLKKVVEQHKS